MSPARQPTLATWPQLLQTQTEPAGDEGPRLLGHRRITEGTRQGRGTWSLRPSSVRAAFGVHAEPRPGSVPLWRRHAGARGGPPPPAPGLLHGCLTETNDRESFRNNFLLI